MNGSKFIEKLNELAGTDGIMALKNGTQRVIPFTILGSLFILFSNFPLPGWNSLMERMFGAGWQYPFTQVSNSTFNILAIIIVVSISYEYAKFKEVEPLLCGTISLVCFLISMPNSVVTEAGETVSGVFSMTWTGGAGSITAIIMALFSAWIYCKVIKKRWVIRMPESVPQGVQDAFLSLVPGLVCITIAFAVCILTKVTGNDTLAELIFSLLQVPLQFAFGTLPGAVFASIMLSLFWMIGIHSSVVGGVVDPIFRANSLANQNLLDAGVALTVANGAYVGTYQISRHFMQMSGSGITIGLVIAMLFFAKSQRYKALGKVAVIPALFNVNEPIIFGFPIVFNPKMLIPFVAVPALGVLTGYLATMIGFIPIVGNFDVPWTTPPLFSGLLIWGWRGALVQLLIIAESFAGYYLFFKKIDQKEYENEEKMS